MDDPDTFSNILGGLEDLARTYPIIFPVHPRTRQRLEQSAMPLQVGSHGTDNSHAGATHGTARHGIILTEPLGYLDFLCLMKHAVLVVSDSGGIQKKPPASGFPV